MASAKTPSKQKKDPVDRELAQIAKLRKTPPTSAALDEAGAMARLARGWHAREAAFVAGLASASPAGRELWTRAKEFVDAGMPSGARDPDEQAAFFIVAGLSPGADMPRWPDFLRRWLAGGLAHAIEVALRTSTVRYVDQPDGSKTLERITDPAVQSQAYGLWLLGALRPELAALDQQGRAELHAAALPLVREATAPAVASLAIFFDDEALARDAIARADAVSLSYRDPWPIEVFEVLRDGETFAHLLSRGGAAFQFFGAGYVLRARGRVDDAALADALVRFFAAAMAEPRRMLDSYVTKLAAVACAIGHPHLAWLFEEHGKHKWLKKHAPFYAARHPSVRGERPPDRSLAARLVPLEPAPRPAGYTKDELEALDPAAREERILGLLPTGHFGAALALKLLVDHPTPRAAVAIFETITHPDFATQMPKPGLHKDLQADLSALAKKHAELAEAISAAKKSKAKVSSKSR